MKLLYILYAATIPSELAPAHVGGFTVSSTPSKPLPLGKEYLVASPLLAIASPADEATDQKVEPVSLTAEAEELEGVLDAKMKTGKLLVAQTAPAVRVAFSEGFDLAPGELTSGHLVAALKKLGFDVVLDTNLGADLCVCEEGTELLRRIMQREKRRETQQDLKSILLGGTVEDEPLPMFTSCCPGWMGMLEKNCPDLIPYVSSCKSPHMMLGAIMKRNSAQLLDREPSEVYLTSVMPCVKKRGESDREVFTAKGVRDVDNVITTVDLIALLKRHDIDPTSLESMKYDSPFQTDEDARGSGAGQLFGATGGVMEAAVRSVYELVTGNQLDRLELDEVRGLDGVKEATIPLFNEETGKGLNMDLRVAVASGLGNAKRLIKGLQDGTVHYDFVEIMACPGGCIGGGGQPRSKDKDALAKRLHEIYKLDKSLPIRRSHDNPTVKRLYNEVVGEIGGEMAHKLLHVHPVYRGDEKAKQNAECVLDENE